MLTDKLRQEGAVANHKGMYRIYRDEGLQLPKRRRKRIRSAKRVPLAPAAHLNERWSMDFMQDMLADGRRFRVLVVMDEFTREVRSHGLLIRSWWFESTRLSQP